MNWLDPREVSEWLTQPVMKLDWQDPEVAKLHKARQEFVRALAAIPADHLKREISNDFFDEDFFNLQEWVGNVLEVSRLLVEVEKL